MLKLAAALGALGLLSGASANDPSKGWLTYVRPATSPPPLRPPADAMLRAGDVEQPGGRPHHHAQHHLEGALAALRHEPARQQRARLVVLSL